MCYFLRMQKNTSKMMVPFIWWHLFEGSFGGENRSFPSKEDVSKAMMDLITLFSIFRFLKELASPTLFKEREGSIILCTVSNPAYQTAHYFIFIFSQKNHIKLTKMELLLDFFYWKLSRQNIGWIYCKL